MSTISKIPVHLLTGFLGSGKTTFLNHLIQQRKPERILVIENEVGQTNIDSQLVIGTIDLDTVNLTAGCLCCSLNEELLDVLEIVSERRDEFDRLVIETTGIADPESVVLPFVSSPAVERVFDFRNTVCLVDAANIDDWLKETEEARRQISFADVLLLNKTDLVEKEKIDFLREKITKINPYAQLYTGEQGQFPVDEILAIQQLEAEGAVVPSYTIAPDHQHRHHDITTFTLTFDQAFDLQGLSYDMMRLLKLHRHQIYRIKGVINANNYPVQAVLQSVRDVVYLTDGLLWEKGKKKESKVVVIGKDLQRDAIEKIFKRHLVKEDS